MILHLVTTGPTHNPDSCDETYTCECLRCHLERGQLVARGIKPDLPQPWEPNQLRAAA
jgi:hypothetical protein